MSIYTSTLLTAAVILLICAFPKAALDALRFFFIGLWVAFCLAGIYALVIITWRISLAPLLRWVGIL